MKTVEEMNQEKFEMFSKENADEAKDMLDEQEDLYDEDDL